MYFKKKKISNFGNVIINKHSILIQNDENLKLDL